VLFTLYRTAADYAAADQAELEKAIEPTGYFRAKTKTLISLGQALCDRFGAEVPDTLRSLSPCRALAARPPMWCWAMPSENRASWWIPILPGLARRFGWTAQTDAEKIEHEVAALLPRREWTAASHQVIWHGRRVCHARRPACAACGVARWCPSFGAGPTDEESARRLVRTGPFS
jgi:endonuclease-3